MSYQKDAMAILHSYMNKLDKKEAEELLFMSSKWNEVSKKLESLIDDLSELEEMSENQLFKLNLYKQFLMESKQQVSKFNTDMSVVITDNQKIFMQSGIDMTTDQIRLIQPRFGKINIQAVNNMIGLSSKGTKLETLLEKSYPASVEKLTDTLIQSVALGRNPMVTARLMKEDMNFNLSRARTIARTEQLAVLRQTNIETMQKSEVTKGWIRVEEDDACDDCQSLDGKHFDFDEEFDTHPNCRGATIPDID